MDTTARTVRQTVAGLNPRQLAKLGAGEPGAVLMERAGRYQKSRSCQSNRPSSG
jgi:hypothetical protein